MEQSIKHTHVIVSCDKDQYLKLEKLSSFSVNKPTEEYRAKVLRKAIAKLIDMYMGKSIEVSNMNTEAFVNETFLFNEGTRYKASDISTMYIEWSGKGKLDIKDKQNLYNDLRAIEGVEVKVSTGNNLYVYGLEIF